jgi:hypothetical protein
MAWLVGARAIPLGPAEDEPIPRTAERNEEETALILSARAGLVVAEHTRR